MSSAPEEQAQQQQQVEQQQQQPQKKDNNNNKKKAAAAPSGAADAPDATNNGTGPQFWDARLKMFDELYAKQQERYESLKQPIKVTLPNGNVMEGESYITCPIDIAKKISNSLAEKAIVAKVDGALWDLGRPLEGDCNIELLDWEDPEARDVFWHSSAHVLGYALEKATGCRLVTGPPLEDGGFFYEGETDRPITESDYTAINNGMADLTKAKARYLRLEISKDDALKMFSYNTFKTRTLASKVPEGGICTVYKCGNLIDPCRGPHVYDTGRIKATAVTKNSSSYFRGDANNETLQRVYAMSFPKDAMLKDWLKLQAEAAKRDHRVLGKQQELFAFHDVSPGTAFWLPHGMRIYNKLIEYQRAQYRRRGFEEVMSPNMYNAKLWQVSGHWDKYADCMFTLECEKEDYGMKPMNCPGHCIMFGMRARSYRELPIRMAEFGVLHRNELSGALTGLTRVRRFQQDDAHIFCSMDQVKDEIDQALKFLSDTYEVLGFKFHMKLSTRPENALGEKATWDIAEEALRTSMNKFCGIPEPVPDVVPGQSFVFDGTVNALKKLKKVVETIGKKGAEAVGGYSGPAIEGGWELNAGDGAFYGPKIDIVVEDALKRRHQLATIQLDFQLPERFGLKFTKATATASASAEGAEKKEEEKKQKNDDDQQQQQQQQKKAAAPATTVVATTPAVTATPGVRQPRVKEPLHVDRRLEPNQERPVMIHRAIFGSLERCIAILTEHFAGKWPLWLSPRQIQVVPVAPAFFDYANQVRQEFHDAGFYADADLSSNTLDKKIREAQVAQYNFIFVVGEKEAEAKAVNIRTRDNKQHGTKTVEESKKWLSELASSWSNDF